MRRGATILTCAAALLSACGKSEFEQAKERYDFIASQGASNAELCREGKRMVSAAADEQRDDYKLLKVENDIKCTSAQLAELEGRAK